MKSALIESGLTDLRATCRGSVLVPEAPAFDAARKVWNGMINRTPALIARCTSTADVSAVLAFARTTGRAVTVRCGGHNVAGTAVADGAVMIDLSGMREVHVDVDRQVAHAGGGSLLRDVDLATTAHGLACPAGVFSYTGLRGLGLGGGYGWRCRTWGLTCDQIIGAQVVLADGSVVEVSERDHPDLVWALRGGGGNFGVVTRFDLHLNRVGPVLVTSAVYGGAAAAGALRVYGEHITQASDDLHLLGRLRHARPGDPPPAGYANQPVLDLMTVCSADLAGSVTECQALFDALPATEVNRRRLSYLELQTMLDDSAPHGRRYYTKSGYLNQLPDGAIAELLAAAARNPARTGSIDVEYLLGAVALTGDAISPFPHRDAPFMVSAYASWDDPAGDAASANWARETISALTPWRHRGEYANYVSQQESMQTAAAMYGPAVYQRLTRIKQQYDPDNTFRGTRAIAPVGLSTSELA
jgi:FAD/FMN-containing dehydrogenase